MYLDRIMPSSGLAALDLSGVASLHLTAGPGCFTTPGPARPAATPRTKYLSRAETDAKRRRFEQRNHEYEARQRQRHEEDLGRTRRDR